MVRVAGVDPGTSGVDVAILDQGRVVGQKRFDPGQLGGDLTGLVRYLEANRPLELIAGPSGYGLPSKRAEEVSETDIALMTLVRPGERHEHGIVGFRQLLRTLVSSGLPVVFLPGVVHLRSVPAYRKINRVDLGTADKLSVAALALCECSRRYALPPSECSFCLVELGSAFTSVLVVRKGEVVDGCGGSCGPVGWRSGGAWDGEVAYLLGALEKDDIFDGGVRAIARSKGQGGESLGSDAVRLFRETLIKTVGGLQTINHFDRIMLSGRLLESDWLAKAVRDDLVPLGPVQRLEGFPNAWVKHAAQGAALIADGLAGGQFRAVVHQLGITSAGGSVLDGLCYRRAAELASRFGISGSS